MKMVSDSHNYFDWQLTKSYRPRLVHYWLVFGFQIHNRNHEYQFSSFFLDIQHILKENCKGKELTNDRLLRIIGISYMKPGRLVKRTAAKITMKIKTSKEFFLCMFLKNCSSFKDCREFLIWLRTSFSLIYLLGYHLFERFFNILYLFLINI